jgi:hypothetical protein
MLYALAIRAGRLGQSVSRNECHKARLTDANPVELINVMGNRCKSYCLFDELSRVTIGLGILPRLLVLMLTRARSWHIGSNNVPFPTTCWLTGMVQTPCTCGRRHLIEEIGALLVIGCLDFQCRQITLQSLGVIMGRRHAHFVIFKLTLGG